MLSMETISIYTVIKAGVYDVEYIEEVVDAFTCIEDANDRRVELDKRENERDGYNPVEYFVKEQKVKHVARAAHHIPLIAALGEVADDRRSVL
jgi:hypothetical protein